jgi:putative two-component system response regulator
MPSLGAKIMVVDDNPANLKLLEEMLQQRGYQVFSFPGGRLALRAAVENPPDLILLDVTMPELSGYEVCERLKADERLAAVPVIFLSGLHEADDKRKAFRSGGIDYISKPFQLAEVYARVETHLKLYQLQTELQSQAQRLEKTITALARLTALNQAKDDFLRLLSHELSLPERSHERIASLVAEALQLTGIDDAGGR